MRSARQMCRPGRFTRNRGRDAIKITPGFSCFVVATKGRVQPTSCTLFFSPSKMQHNPRRQPQIILRAIKQIRMDIVALKTPGQYRQELVIQPASRPGRKGSIRCKVVRVRAISATTRMNVMKTSFLMPFPQNELN